MMKAKIWCKIAEDGDEHYAYIYSPNYEGGSPKILESVNSKQELEMKLAIMGMKLGNEVLMDHHHWRTPTYEVMEDK